MSPIRPVSLHRSGIVCYAILALTAVDRLVPVAAAAQSGEQGSVCVRDFEPGLTCESADVQIAALTAVDILDPCLSEADTATLTLDVTLSTEGAPDRYDVGFFVALAGGSALDGPSCYHDFLDPPFSTEPVYPIHNGPWANLEPFDPNDECGDMHGNTEVTKTLRTPLLPVQVACTDTDDDGTVDVSVCTAWRAGSNPPQSTCDGLSGAVPNSNDRCGCARVDVLPEPRAALSLACGAGLLVALGGGRRKEA